MCRGADAPRDEVVQEAFDVLRAKLARMAPLVKEDEAPRPADVRTRRERAVVAKPQLRREAVEQLGRC